jgi:hypothetical protein
MRAAKAFVAEVKERFDLDGQAFDDEIAADMNEACGPDITVARNRVLAYWGIAPGSTTWKPIKIPPVAHIARAFDRPGNIEEQVEELAEEFGGHFFAT